MSKLTKIALTRFGDDSDNCLPQPRTGLQLQHVPDSNQLCAVNK